MQIHMQIAGTRKKEKSIIEYFNKVKNLTDTLTSIDNSLSDEEFITYMPSGLDNEYDSLVTSVTTRPDVTSLNDLYAHLLSFEVRIVHNNSIDHVPYSS